MISGEENEKYSKENRENLLLARIRTRARQKTTQSGQLQTQSESTPFKRRKDFSQCTETAIGSLARCSSRQSSQGGTALAQAQTPNEKKKGESMNHASVSKKSRTQRSRKVVTKDPHGGLTAAGRKEFLQKEGAHLKPGVRKSEREMTLEEMKRKGSWAARFYGRSGSLPPLRDKHGKPTRFALTAAAWGEPVPKTNAAARKIAEKGRRLLARAKMKKPA